MIKKIMLVISAIVLLFILCVLLTDYRKLFNIKAREQFTDFKIFHDTPGFQDEFPPQGLTVVGSNLIISNHHLDQKSWIYELNLSTGETNRSFTMPAEISHVGGLCWDGESLYAADYKTNKLYQIDYDISFSSGIALIINAFDTTLQGTSACGIILDREIPLIIISDFKNTSETLIIDLNEALKSGTAENCILYRYKNESFSQGLSYWNGYIFEVENKVHKSIVNVYDFEEIYAGQNNLLVDQFFLPDKGGQDIYIDDNYIFLSDAVSFKIYEDENSLDFLAHL